MGCALAAKAKCAGHSLPAVYSNIVTMETKKDSTSLIDYLLFDRTDIGQLSMIPLPDLM